MSHFARLFVALAILGTLNGSSCRSQQSHGEGSSQDTMHAHTNRLIHESSPYLLQHAHNPVDWFPWGDEAFAKAKAENKLVLVSIGYSSRRRHTACGAAGASLGAAAPAIPAPG